MNLGCKLNRPAFSAPTFGMSRLRLKAFDYCDPEATFFVTARAYDRTSPFVDARIAELVLSGLDWLRAERGTAVYAYCLMPDHLHLLLQLRDPRYSLGRGVASLKLHTTSESWKLGYRGKLWQARFFDHILRCYDSGDDIVDYILDNPVRRGLVRDGEAYPYCGMPDPM